MDTLKILKKKLQNLVDTKASYQRTLKIASVLSVALETVGLDPILVGGSAVEIYSRGGYATQDIDMVCEGGIDLQQTMRALGFERLGKDYIFSNKKLYVEFPASSLGPTETIQVFNVEGFQLKIVSIEDLIIDRLCAFKFWGSAIDGLNSILLLETNPCEEARLLTRAQQEEVLDALEAVRNIYATVVRKKLSPKQSNALLEKAARHLKGK